jgi:hypothetical protein
MHICASDRSVHPPMAHMEDTGKPGYGCVKAWTVGIPKGTATEKTHDWKTRQHEVI